VTPEQEETVERLRRQAVDLGCAFSSVWATGLVLVRMVLPLASAPVVSKLVLPDGSEW
jgi:hypothetical protein